MYVLRRSFFLLQDVGLGPLEPITHFGSQELPHQGLDLPRGFILAAFVDQAAISVQYEIGYLCRRGDVHSICHTGHPTMSHKVTCVSGQLASL